MRRGFKTEAERLAADLRAQLGCSDDEPVDLEAAARHLGVDLISADQLVPLERLQELEDLQPGAFSAATFRLMGNRKTIVFNPLHGIGRTRSNQAHELAHVMLGHSVRTIERVGNFKFLTCDAEQEEEADWLGGCLLLPRAVLLKSAFADLGPAQIAEAYETSEPMARFRLNASGVLVQVGRARSKKGRPASSPRRS